MLLLFLTQSPVVLLPVMRLLHVNALACAAVACDTAVTHCCLLHTVAFVVVACDAVACDAAVTHCCLLHTVVCGVVACDIITLTLCCL